MADEEIKIVPDEPRRGWRERGQTIFAAPRSGLVGFADFIRERGVMGLAIGFVLGTSVQKVVTAFVNDIVTPFINIFLGRTDGFAKFTVGPFAIGDFLSVTIDFLILLAIIYFVFKGLGLDRLDKQKE
ncbi:MscL family protein [Candidatus Kaiserbacteria bacterium]|nr:MscL family protein [Candidatus Kaiserbacteria bacterium]